MSELKLLFAKKPSCDTMIALLNEDFNQRFFDNSRYLERLNQKYLWVTEFNDLPRVTEQMQLQAKPVKYLYQTLQQLACQPIKAATTDSLLAIWQQSCVWQAHAKSFIALHASSSTGGSSRGGAGNAA